MVGGITPDCLLSFWPVIEATHDGETNGEADWPAGEDDDVGWSCVLPVLAVHDWGGHGKVPGSKEFKIYFVIRSL